ncbi:MAG: SDR family oxidoreductase [Proteobacteria bacterium]|nr:SDR family oxidoreductase [Pseudomonadota bacterium]
MEKQLFKLDGRVAVVTGGARGIGRAIATGLAEAGADLVIGDVDAETAAETCRELGKSGVRAIPVRCDISRSQDADALIEAGMDRFDRIDILFNNAGISGAAKPLIGLSDEEWNRTLAVNLSGMFYCSRAAAKEMIKRQEGKIVNITSVASFRPLQNSGDYCSSKGGAHMLTQVLALELIRHNIKVNEICPGMFDTNLAPKIKEAMMKNVRKMIPIGRFAQAEEIKGLAIFLASPASDYLVGASIPIDGGIGIRD